MINEQTAKMYFIVYKDPNRGERMPVRLKVSDNRAELHMSTEVAGTAETVGLYMDTLIADLQALREKL